VLYLPVYQRRLTRASKCQ